MEKNEEKEFLKITFYVKNSKGRSYIPRKRSTNKIEKEDYEFWVKAKEQVRGYLKIQFEGGFITPEIKLGKALGEFQLTFKYNVDVDVDPESILLVYNISKQVFNNFIFDFFLIMNLSRPGCVDYYNIIIKSDIDKKIRQIQKLVVGRTFLKYDDLKISNYIFETFNDTNFFETYGVKLKSFELSETLNWYINVRAALSQVANSHIERAIFSLFHIVTSNSILLPEVMWTAHAIESLFNNARSDHHSVIVARAIKFLSVKQNEKNLKKALSKFQKVRSKFVHGDFNIYHPTQNEILDQDFANVNKEIKEAIEIPIHIIIASLQKMIELGYHSLRFDEKVVGLVKIVQ